MLNKLETTLNELLNTKAPFKIPEAGRKSLAKALWWIALVIGILQLWGAIALWQLGHAANRLVDYANNLAMYYGAPNTVTDQLGMFFYLAVAVMVAVGVMQLLAVSGLKAMKKSGWNLLFYSVLLEAALAVVRLFDSVGGRMSGFFGAAVGAVIGAYLLFQARDYFTSKAAGKTAKK